MLRLANCATPKPSATSIDIEHIFSRSRLLLSHTRSHLSTQMTHAVLCVGQWSVCNLVKTEDVVVVSKMEDEDGEEEEMDEGWDTITID
jgi:hypothetical protein